MGMTHITLSTGNTMSHYILTVGPSGKATRYCSQRAVSRVLTGDGSDNLRSTVKRRLDAGGGFIGRVWVQNSEITSIVRPRLAK